MEIGPSPAPADLHAAMHAELASMRAQLMALQTAQGATSQRRLPSGMKAPQLGDFRGDKKENLDTWLFQADLLFSLHELTNEQCITYAGLCLKNKAGDWFKVVVQTNGHLKTWNEFKEAMRAFFITHDVVKAARDALVSLKQANEYADLRSYTAQFLHLTQHIKDLPDAELADRYVRGLKAPIQKEVIMRQADNSLAEAIKTAERYDVQWERYRSSAKSAPTFPQASSNLPVRKTWTRPDPMQLDAIQQVPAKTDPSLGPRKGTPEYDRRLAANLCLYCGAAGHRVAECRKRAADQSAHRKPEPGVGNGQRTLRGA